MGCGVKLHNKPRDSYMTQTEVGHKIGHYQPNDDRQLEHGPISNMYIVHIGFHFNLFLLQCLYYACLN